MGGGSPHSQIPLAPPRCPCSCAQSAIPLGFNHFTFDPTVEHKLDLKKWGSESLHRIKREGFWGNRLIHDKPDEPFLVFKEWDLLIGILADLLAGARKRAAAL
jgi:hypothetical protein